jgi:hypothetical protein
VKGRAGGCRPAPPQKQLEIMFFLLSKNDYLKSFGFIFQFILSLDKNRH